jgi:hypothetical protein
MERTTVAADAEDVAILRDEAKRRGVILSTVLREAVHLQATTIRSRRRPHIGIGRSGIGAAAAASEHPDEPYEKQPPRGRA